MPEVYHMELPSDESYLTLVRWVNTGSDNGLVPSGSKQLPKPMLTQDYAAVRRY